MFSPEYYSDPYWINASVILAKSYDTIGSLIHDFEDEGFYITNGQFKGAMLLEGFTPRHLLDLNWVFKIKNRVSRRVRGHGYYDFYDGSIDHYSVGQFDLKYARLLTAAGHLKGN